MDQTFKAHPLCANNCGGCLDAVRLAEGVKVWCNSLVPHALRLRSDSRVCGSSSSCVACPLAAE